MFVHSLIKKMVFMRRCSYDLNLIDLMSFIYALNIITKTNYNVCHLAMIDTRNINRPSHGVWRYQSYFFWALD